MLSIRSKYGDYMSNIFDGKDENKVLETEVEEEEMEDPTPYRISTMTTITSFSCIINLRVVTRHFKLDNKVVKVMHGVKPVKNNGKNKKKKKEFFNQSTIIVQLDPLKKINVKIFSNGKIQMTGVKRLEDAQEALRIIIDRLKTTEGIIEIDKLLDNHIDNYLLKKNIDISEMSRDLKVGKIEEFEDSKEIYSKSIEFDDISFNPIEIVLINSDFKVNFKIKRNVLFNILQQEYGIVATFDPGIYPGINCKYYWNSMNDKDIKNGIKKEGVCYCPDYTNCECTKKMCGCECNGKGKGVGINDCKIITIACFQSGSIIITGARQIKQIEDCKNFIVGVLRKHYSLIKKIDFFAEEEPNKQPVKRYPKTSDIVYIDKNKLNNKFNSKVYQKYLDFKSKIINDLTI